MTKIKLALASLGTFLLPVVAFALNGTQPPGSTSIQDLPSLVTKIENFVWIIFGCIAVVMFVVAGILFLTSQGQAEKIQNARSAFLWGVAGVVVGIIAYSILAIIGSALGV